MPDEKFKTSVTSYTIENETSPALELRNVGKTYRDGNAITVALDSVNLSVARGESLCVLGPSGSGKSTILSLMGCLLLPTSGEVYFGGKNIVELGDSGRGALRRRNIGFMFQEAVALEGLSVWENVAIPLLITGSAREAQSAARERIADVGLLDKFNARPCTLSFGQRKRLELARALMHEPQVILADEPTGGLDRATAEDVMKILLGQSGRNGSTVVFVTHDPHFADWATCKVEIRDGRIL